MSNPTPLPANSQPLRSIHSNSFPELLRQLEISLVVSTYQAGKVVLLRAEKQILNTHFRILPKPMGLALHPSGCLAIGAGSKIFEFWNVPVTASKLSPSGKYDACFLSRNLHVTGNVDIHEMAWGQAGLWFVNTRFSCLCTLDREHSFIPRWRPPFISAFAPEDRCHLNGLELVEGVPKYVTALGTTNTPGGWRDRKADGGILMDVVSNDIIAQGLSMPHSPRWYRDRLWVLESGQGSLATVDLATGQLETFIELPGFTRGIDFCGPFAFIGLSQVRESAVFSGIPLTERVSERICGVWVVNLDTAEIVAFLKFEDAVQEIFAVQVLQGMKFPELLVEDTPLLQTAYVLPEHVLAEVELSDIQPSRAEQCFQKGLQAYLDQQRDLAVQLYQEGLELDPHNMVARYQFGTILLESQQWQAGIDQLEQVLAERTDHYEAHNSVGAAYLKLGDRKKAQWHLERAIALNPHFALAQNNLRIMQQEQ